MPKEESGNSYNEHVFEIRYKPNAKVLDNRGGWAEKISHHMRLLEWQIIENRLDVFDKENKDTCFVAFKNAGFMSHNPPTANYFPDQAVKFCRLVLELEGFGSPLFVIRIGVRSRFYSAFEGSFKELFNRYSTRFATLTDEAKKILDAKLIDIGCPVNFEDEHGRFNTSSGPMEDEQARVFFSQAEHLAKVGLFFDIDYWQRPKKELKNANILELISVYARKAWDKHQRIRDLIMAD